MLKDPILRIANAFNESCMAGSISNIGKVTLPEAAVPFVNRFDVFVSTDKLQACVCSFGSQLTVSFTSAFRSTNVRKLFPPADPGGHPGGNSVQQAWQDDLR